MGLRREGGGRSKELLGFEKGRREESKGAWVMCSCCGGLVVMLMKVVVDFW